jgi:hypothetical protein
MPTCEWQLSEDGSSCDVVQSPCDEAKTEKPPIKGCPPRAGVSSRKAEAPKALAQGPIAGGPPEDPITPPVCSYQKSEDGSSCDKIVVPCQESGEVPPLNGCPARTIESSRKAEAPIAAKKEAKKEEKKEEAKAEAKLVQIKGPIVGGPPEDPITPPPCTYQKSEDGTSCDKVVVPCQETGEV